MHPLAILGWAAAALRKKKPERTGREELAYVNVLAGWLPRVEMLGSAAQHRAIERSMIQAVRDAQRSAARIREAWNEARKEEAA